MEPQSKHVPKSARLMQSVNSLLEEQSATYFAKHRRRMHFLSVIQFLIAGACAALAWIHHFLDVKLTERLDLLDSDSGESTTSSDTRSANGLYYGATVFFVMDAIASVIGSMLMHYSQKHWNTRSAFYIRVCTIYQLFCAVFESGILVLLILYAHEFAHFQILQWMLTLVTISLSLERVFIFKTMCKWKSILMQRGILHNQFHLDWSRTGLDASITPSRFQHAQEIQTPDHVSSSSTSNIHFV